MLRFLKLEPAVYTVPALIIGGTISSTMSCNSIKGVEGKPSDGYFNDFHPGGGDETSDSKTVLKSSIQIYVHLCFCVPIVNRSHGDMGALTVTTQTRSQEYVTHGREY